jgi:hypothetical protein
MWNYSRRGCGQTFAPAGKRALYRRRHRSERNFEPLLELRRITGPVYELLTQHSVHLA